MSEIRMPIQGYEGLYDVSNQGNVYSLLHDSSRRKRKLKPYNHNGYLRVNLYDSKGKVKKYYVHRLVAKTFIVNPSNYPVINHIDSNKKNNEISNLEWCSQKKNIKHSFDLELQTRPIPTYVDGKRFKSMKEASLSIGLKGFRIAYERLQRGNKFLLYGHSIMCGDENVQD